jgi:hypothetical protein
MPAEKAHAAITAHLSQEGARLFLALSLCSQSDQYLNQHEKLSRNVLEKLAYSLEVKLICIICDCDFILIISTVLEN